MDKKLHGFAHPSAVLEALRSNSPVKITRDETGQSINAQVWPGEGAGYAGGIMKRSS